MEFKERQAILDEVASFDLQPGESKQVSKIFFSWEYVMALAKELNIIGGADLWFSVDNSPDGYVIYVQILKEYLK